MQRNPTPLDFSLFTHRLPQILENIIDNNYFFNY